MITNNIDKKIRGRTLAGLTLRDLVRRGHTRDLNPYARSAIISTIVCALLNATSAIELAIWPVIAGPTLPTTKGALG
ncbi:hypothetical protein Tco_1024620 [Tanacetum coccineum]